MNAAEPGPMLEGRQADSARRRQRVIAALDRAAADELIVAHQSLTTEARLRSVELLAESVGHTVAG